MANHSRDPTNFVTGSRDGGGGGLQRALTPHAVNLVICLLRPPLNKSLFPVQRVVIIMASREAAKSSSFFFL